MNRFGLVFALSALSLLLFGCGGGKTTVSSANFASKGAGSASIKIKWPAPSKGRLIYNETSSITVTLTGPSTSNPAPQTFSNPNTGGVTTMEFTSLAAGSWTANAVAASATGTSLSTGSTTFTVAPGQQSTFDINLGSTITGFKFTSNTNSTTLAVGDTITLTATPIDVNNATVLTGTDLNNITLTPQSPTSAVSIGVGSIPGTFTVTGITATSAIVLVATERQSGKTGTVSITVSNPGYGVFGQVGIPGQPGGTGAVRADGNIVFSATNASDYEIQANFFTKNGTSIVQTNLATAFPNVNAGPQGIAARNGLIFVGDGNSVDKYQYDGNTTINQINWTPLPQLSNVIDLVASVDGQTLYVANNGNKITPLKSSDGSRKSGDITLPDIIQGVAIDAANNLYATTSGQKLYMISAGTSVGVVISSNVGSASNAIDVSSSGNIYVAPRNGGVFSVYSPTGTLLYSVNTSGNGSQANSITVDSRGYVYLFDETGVANQLAGEIQAYAR